MNRVTAILLAGLSIAGGVRAAEGTADDPIVISPIRETEAAEPAPQPVSTPASARVPDHDLHAEVSSFSADMVLTGAQGNMAARFYAAEGKSRMEMQGSVSIARIDRNKVYILLTEQKTYIEQEVTDEMSAQASTGEASVVSRLRLADEMLGGRFATKYEVVLSNGGKQQTVYQWMAEDVPVPVRMEAVDGSWAVEYRNVIAGPQPENLFEVPSDYQKMDMPDLPQDPAKLAEFQKAGEEMLAQQQQNS